MSRPEVGGMTCRVLPHVIGDGPTNMATDEALLDSVAHDPGAAVVRTYAWSVPTLSLGYFQPYATAEADPRWSGRAIVRRATGGGALWHDREITYAVIVPATHPLGRPSTALYRAIHQAIGDRLRGAGLAARRRGDIPTEPPAGDDRPFLCFQDRDDDDIVVGAVKLVGSAQRRRSGAVLQHGSLLLARSPTTPELAGLRDLPDGRASRSGGSTLADDLTDWAAILRLILPETIGGVRIEGDLTDWERDRADTLRKGVYDESNWTRRR